MNDLVDLIKILPEVFYYFVPGAIFLYLYYFMCSKDQSRGSDNYFLFKCLIISFIIIELTKIFGIYQYKITTILISLFLSYLLSKIYMSSWFKRSINQFVVNRSIHANIWNEIVDIKFGMYAKAYIPSEKVIYYGALVKYEEKDNDYFIILSQYESYTYDNDELDDYSGKKECLVAINIANISRIELFYNPQSEIINT